MQGTAFFHRILLPLDQQKDNAQQLGLYIAERFNSEVTLLHVVSPRLMYSGVKETYAEASDSTELSTRLKRDYEKAIREGGKNVSDAATQFKEKGISVYERVLDNSDPAEAIIEEAENEEYGLVIMGQSDSKEKKPHLGSVAEKVSQHSRIPVLIAREKNTISKILVPIDGSENAGKALEYASAIAKEAEAEITLLYVLEKSFFKSKTEEAKKTGALMLSKSADKVSGIELSQRLELGNPGKTITQIADRDEYDLIVIGSKGQGAKKRFLLGSVSSHVIHYASRSVLIVPLIETVEALSPERTIRRLVNLHIASMGSVGSYLRDKIDESSLQGIFEYQSEKYSEGLNNIVWRADEIAKDMISLNFQPFGMEAKYTGDKDRASITITKCPLPEKSLQTLDFLRIIKLEEQDVYIMNQMFASPDRLSSTWDWPPKKMEICGTCRIVMPRLGERLGFNWRHRINDSIPPQCVFDIEIKK